jgi:hypothetical protein
MTNQWIQHVKHYSQTHNVPYPVAMIHARASYTASPKQKPAGGTRGRPRKGGALNLKEFGLQQWDKVPDQYKPGLQSLGEAAYKDVGFGLKKRRGRKTKGGNIFDDIGNTFRPVADVFRPVVDAYKPIADFQTNNIKTVVNDPIVKRISKVAAKEVLKYDVAAAGPAAAAAATAAGHPELAPAAALLAISLANEAQPFGNDAIDRYDGIGMKKRRGRPKKTHGMALLQAGY